MGTSSFDDPPPGPAPEQIALHGADGARAEALLARAKAQGAAVLAALARRAVARLVRNAGADAAKPGALFTATEQRRLGHALAATIGTAHLLGAARIRRRADQAEQFSAARGADARRFCGGPGSGVPGPCPEGGAPEHGGPRPARDPIHVHIQGERIAGKHYENMRSLLSSMQRGDYHPTDVQKDVEHYASSAQTANSKNFAHRFTALKAMAQRNGYSAEALASPEMAAVRDAYRTERDRAAEKMDAMADIVRANADHFAAHPDEPVKIGADDRTALADLHNELVNQHYAAVHKIGDAVDAFVAKHGSARMADPPAPLPTRRFSDVPTDLRCFDETGTGGIEPMPPTEAVDYFRRLVPGLDVDAETFAATIGREAFTLAVTTDQALLDKVYGIITDRVATGQRVGAAAGEVQAILEAAGVAPANPAYSEMVVRTGMMESYNAGAQRELAGLADVFPVWEYANPGDSRSRPEHAARAGKYWPAARHFTDVRGTDPGDVCNCRCTFVPIDGREWADLQAAGERAEDE